MCIGEVIPSITTVGIIFNGCLSRETYSQRRFLDNSEARGVPIVCQKVMGPHISDSPALSTPGKILPQLLTADCRWVYTLFGRFRDSLSWCLRIHTFLSCFELWLSAEQAQS